MRPLRPLRLRRRARLRRGGRATSTASAAGATASGSGTRRPTSRSSGPLDGAARPATSSGSATGATASATAELRRVPARAGARLGLSGTRPWRPLSASSARRPRGSGIALRGLARRTTGARAFARHRVTVHVPRRPYVEALPGIPRSARSRRSPAASRSSRRRGRTPKASSRRGGLPRRAERRGDEAAPSRLLARSGARRALAATAARRFSPGTPAPTASTSCCDARGARRRCAERSRTAVTA